MESLNSNSQERELHQLQQMQDKAKESCMTSFRLLHSFLQVLSYNELKINGCFERAFATLFEQDVQTFTCSMLLHLDQLEKQLDKDEFQEDRSMAAFWVINKQFQMFIDSQFTWDYDSQMTEKYFAEYTRIEVRQFRDSLIQHMESVKKSIDERAQLKRQYDRRVNKRLMQMQESKVVSSKALDASLVVTECSGTKSDEHITSSSSGTYITHVVDADIRPVNDQVSSAEVHLTAQHNVLANEQQHTDQSEPSYDTYLLEKVDSNTTPDSTNMSHRGGEIDQDAEQDQVKSPLLKAEFLKTNDMVEKEVYNELSNRFLQLEKHCISLEISMQQKEESFQSHKPCKNQESPEFREFFEINDSKAQLHAKTTLICNLKNQIKSVKEASNEAKLKKEINVLETINIELESSVAKLLAENEKLNKKNEHLKQTYKELYDSIKKTRIQTKDHNDSLIAQVNSKTVKNADLKAQIQEKKPISFTPHYLPKVREYVLAKPHYVIAPGSSRNSQEEYYGSNDMAHNHYLKEARKKTQERNRNSKPSVMPSVRLQNTANGSTPNPKRTSQTSRSLPTSKSSCVTIMVVPKADHSRNSSSFSDSKHFFCSTCHKCVFNANHDACITKLLNEVNSHKASLFNDKMTSIHISLSLALQRQNDVCSHQFRPRSSMIDNVYSHQFRPRSLTTMASADNTLGPAPQRKESSGPEPQLMTPRIINSGLEQNIPSPTPAVPPTKNDWDSLFQPMFDKYFKPPPNVDHPVPEVPTTVPAASTCSPSSTTVEQDAPSTSTSQTTSEQQSSVIPQGVEDYFYNIEVAHMDNDSYFGIPIPKPSSEETTLQGVIPSKLHHLNQSFDTLTKLTKKHPLENVIGDPSRSILTRSQLQEHAIWGYFDANDNPIPFGGNGLVKICYLKGRIMVLCSLYAKPAGFSTKEKHVRAQRQRQMGS
ncbi:hypothetical protein Tco_0577997 [Tanacetum coccineum]